MHILKGQFSRDKERKREMKGPLSMIALQCDNDVLETRSIIQLHNTGSSQDKEVIDMALTGMVCTDKNQCFPHSPKGLLPF